MIFIPSIDFVENLPIILEKKIRTYLSPFSSQVTQLELLISSTRIKESETRIPPTIQSNDSAPVPKVAERVKLNRNIWKSEGLKSKSVDPDLSPTTTNNILNNNIAPTEEKGTEEMKVSKNIFDLISASSPARIRWVEHLVEPIQTESIIREVSCHGNENEEGTKAERVLRELILDKERLAAQLGHLATENEVLRVNLEASKDTADSLYEKLGKHESNDTALRLLLKYR